MGNVRPQVDLCSSRHLPPFCYTNPAVSIPHCHPGISLSEQVPLPTLCTMGQNQGPIADSA